MTIGSSHSAQELAGWTSALRKRRRENTFQCEYDKSALKTLQANETTSREYAYDLKNVSVEKVREILNANAKVETWSHSQEVLLVKAFHRPGSEKPATILGETA